MKKYILIVVLLAGLLSCSSEVTTKTAEQISNDFTSLTEKSLFLEKYLHPKSTLTQLDFNIVYHDNSTGLFEAPNDWDIRFLAVVPNTEIDNWLEGLEPVTGIVDTAWLDSIPTNINHQFIHQWYHFHQQLWIGVDRNNGVIAYRDVAQ